MAYLADYLTPDEQKQQQALSTGAPALSGSGGGTAGSSPTTPSQTPVQSTATPALNLADYFGANQGASQAMGQGLADSLSAKAADAAGPSMAAPTTEAVANYYNPYGDPFTHTTTPAMTDAQKSEAKDTAEAFSRATSTNLADRQAYLGETNAATPGGYTQGMGAMDAYLLGGAGMEPLRAAQGQWSDPLAKAQSYTPTDSWTYPPGTEWMKTWKQG